MNYTEPIKKSGCRQVVRPKLPKPEGRHRKDHHFSFARSGPWKDGHRVLLVDADPQGDLTKSMGWRAPDDLEVTISEHIVASITGRKLDSRKGILKHKEGMHLMPANIRLADVESALFMAIDREVVIKEWLSDLERKYDYIIIDCMPAAQIPSQGRCPISNR